MKYMVICRWTDQIGFLRKKLRCIHPVRIQRLKPVQIYLFWLITVPMVLPVTISRCSNNYGPYNFPEKLIPLMIINALHDKKLPVYGTGDNVRDWLYIEDHCSAIDLIIRKGRVGEVYNIGEHNEKTNLEVVKTILKELGKGEDLITFVKDRSGHDRRYAIDPAKIHCELGWLPQTSFAEEIKKTIKWYLDNEDWWQRIISGEYQDYYMKMYGDR